MSLERLNAPGLRPPRGPFVHGVRAGGFVFVTGQVAVDGAGAVVGAGDIAAQAAQALENVRGVLAAGGCTLADVVKVTVFLKDIRHLGVVSDVRRHYFGEHLPASTTVEVSSLGSPEFLVEIEAIALVPELPPALDDEG